MIDDKSIYSGVAKSPICKVKSEKIRFFTFFDFNIENFDPGFKLKNKKYTQIHELQGLLMPGCPLLLQHAGDQLLRVHQVNT